MGAVRERGVVLKFGSGGAPCSSQEGEKHRARSGIGRGGAMCEARVKCQLYMSPVERQRWAFFWVGSQATLFGGGPYSVPASENRFMEAGTLRQLPR